MPGAANRPRRFSRFRSGQRAFESGAKFAFVFTPQPRVVSSRIACCPIRTSAVSVQAAHLSRPGRARLERHSCLALLFSTLSPAVRLEIVTGYLESSPVAVQHAEFELEARQVRGRPACAPVYSRPASRSPTWADSAKHSKPLIGRNRKQCHPERARRQTSKFAERVRTLQNTAPIACYLPATHRSARTIARTRSKKIKQFSCLHGGR